MSNNYPNNPNNWVEGGSAFVIHCTINNVALNIKAQAYY